MRQFADNSELYAAAPTVLKFGTEARTRFALFASGFLFVGLIGWPALSRLPAMALHDRADGVVIAGGNLDDLVGISRVDCIANGLGAVLVRTDL